MTIASWFLETFYSGQTRRASNVRNLAEQDAAALLNVDVVSPGSIL